VVDRVRRDEFVGRRELALVKLSSISRREASPRSPGPASFWGASSVLVASSAPFVASSDMPDPPLWIWSPRLLFKDIFAVCGREERFS
jgi:hypothetical protein